MQTEAECPSSEQETRSNEETLHGVRNRSQEFKTAVQNKFALLKEQNIVSVDRVPRYLRTTISLSAAAV